MLHENPKNNSYIYSSSGLNIAVNSVKPYATPNQRTHAQPGRRKFGDKSEHSTISANEEWKNQIGSLRNGSIADHRDAGGRLLGYEDPHARLIPLHGCSHSEAYQLLNQRWAAAMDAYNDPSVDRAEKPVMHSRMGTSAWGHFKMPHEMLAMAAVESSGSQVDFLSKLKFAMKSANP